MVDEIRQRFVSPGFIEPNLSSLGLAQIFVKTCFVKNTGSKSFKSPDSKFQSNR